MYEKLYNKFIQELNSKISNDNSAIFTIHLQTV